MEILNLSVAPGHDISGKKISSLSCFTYFGTWVKILMRLGDLSSLIFFFNLMKSQALWVGTWRIWNGSPALVCSTEGRGWVVL